MSREDARQNALLRAVLSAQKSAVSSSHSDGLHDLVDDKLFALSYALKILGDRRQPIAADVQFRELLDLNNIRYREVKVPSNLLNLSRSVLICFQSKDDSSLVIYTDGLSTCCATKSQVSKLKNPHDYQLKPIGFEIYPGFPSPLKNVFELLHFTFYGHITPLILIIVASIGLSFVSVAVPLLTAFIIGTVVPMSDFRLIVETSLLVLLILFFTIASDAFSELAIIRLDSILNLRLEASLWSHMLRLPLSFFRRIETADLVDRVGSISEIQDILSDGLISSFLDLVFSAPSLVLMFVFMPQLAGITTVYTLITSTLISVLVYRSVRFEKRFREEEASLTSMSLQNVVGMPQIRTSGSEAFVFENWMRRVAKMATTMTRVDLATDNIQILSALFVPLGELIIFIGFYSSIQESTSAPFVVNNQSVAIFLAFQTAYISFTSKISSFSSTAAETIAQIIVLWQRSALVIHALPEEGQRHNKRCHDLQGNFQILNLDARYPDQDHCALSDVSLQIPVGSYTAITGPSGSGKTTLLRCLLQLIDYESGLIKVDGLNLLDIDIRHYRRQIGVVLQNNQLPSGTIFEIVRAGRTHTRDEVWDVLEKAAVADDVHRMPMQLETSITEGAMTISAGQRQRIALARALLSQPKTLFLDEATSALDANLQAQVINVLEDLNITRIAIAHRLSTISSADQVVLLRSGQVDFVGDYASLHRLYMKEP